jgi:hypothetical protein
MDGARDLAQVLGGPEDGRRSGAVLPPLRRRPELLARLRAQRRSELGRQREGSFLARLRGLGERATDGLVGSWRETFTEGRRLGLEVIVVVAAGAVRQEWRASGESLVRKAAEGIDVGRGTDSMRS